MNPHPLKTALAAGRPVLGTWALIPCPAVHEIFGIAGMDFQILDMEHGPYDLPAVEAGIRACEAVSCSPLVRVPAIDGSVIQSVLDLGAHGIVVPHVENEEDVKAMLAYMRFPPSGSRGFNPFTRAARYTPTATQAGKLQDDFPLSCAIVESVDACGRIDVIADVPGLDVVYIGAYDLSVSMGKAGDVRHPDVLRLIDQSVRAIRKTGKAAGMMVRTEDEMSAALSMGAKMLAWGVDTDLIRMAAAGPVGAFRANVSTESSRP